MFLKLIEWRRLIKRALVYAVLLVLGTNVVAQEIVVEGGKAYKMHTVVKGEGLYRLSVDNGITQEELISANPQLKNTGLVEGVVIRIPLKNSDQTAALTKTTRSKTAYTVKSGDTLLSISRANGMTLSEFLDLNPNVASNTLSIGQQVYVYTSTSSSVTTSTTHVVQKGETAYSISKSAGITVSEFYKLNPQSTSGLKENDIVLLPSSAEETYVLHVIMEGETLYSIGVKYGVKAQQIIDANTSLDPRTLPVGSTIRIPSSSIPSEDDNFYYHRMQKGETLYSLCIKYDLLQEKIMEVNSGVDWNALRIGQVIAVPKKKEVTVSYTERTVKKRETLYSISQEEGVEVAAIVKANPEVSANGLQKGMTIRIPHIAAADNIVPATTDTAFVGTASDAKYWTDDYNYWTAGKPKVNVFLMLPFNAYSEIKALRESGQNIQVSSYAFKTRRYVEFYEGVRMALDSLAESGANIGLTVFDTNNRLDMINQLNTASVTPDIIIGPAHKSEMADVMKYANEKKVPVVLPFGQCDSTILDNPYIFQASVIDSITGKEIYGKMVSEMGDAHVIIISPNSKNTAEVQRSTLLTRLCDANNVEYVMHVYNTKAPTAFLSKLSTEKRNIILLPTHNEARVNSVLTSIAGVIEQKGEARVELWGTSEWLTFQTIEVDVFHKLNTKVYTTYAVDETNPQVRWLMNKYRNLYFTEPIAFTPYFQKLKTLSGYSEYGLWGYDIAFKFVGARVFRGPQFVRNVNAYNPQMIQSNFKMRNLTNWGGAVNVGLKTIVFKENGEVEINTVE